MSDLTEPGHHFTYRMCSLMHNAEELPVHGPDGLGRAFREAQTCGISEEKSWESIPEQPFTYMHVQQLRGDYAEWRSNLNKSAVPMCVAVGAICDAERLLLLATGGRCDFRSQQASRCCHVDVHE
jgi:hypothetical protein